jgi:hypothetical protein
LADDLALSYVPDPDFDPTAWATRVVLGRKVKKLNLLEFTGGCRMSGQFTKVGLNRT